MLFTYGAQDLKQQFPELKKLQDLTVVPLVTLVIEKFLKDMEDNWTKYGINHFEAIENPAKKKFLKDMYSVMMDMAFVKIVVGYSNIYITDGEGGGYVISNIEFNSGATEMYACELHRKFIEFVKTFELAQLKYEAAVLLSKIQRQHLIAEIEKFYFYGNFLTSDP